MLHAVKFKDHISADLFIGHRKGPNKLDLTGSKIHPWIRQYQGCSKMFLPMSRKELKPVLDHKKGLLLHRGPGSPKISFVWAQGLKMSQDVPANTRCMHIK
ncbi:hypothetical protein TNCV_768001 [Trichonephila clavipes]|nr:hypothetical protein TNCV_768001 [Trichonephila clavipes]